jgi:hypothetical protein
MSFAVMGTQWVLIMISMRAIRPETRWSRLTIVSGLPSRRNVHGFPDGIVRSVADEIVLRERSILRAALANPR